MSVNSTSSSPQDAAINIQTQGSVAGVQAAQTGIATAIDQTDASTVQLRTMNDLKEQAPKIYDAFMMYFANELKGQMDRSNDRIKKAMREART